jgi:predicted MFS family arabinose efflux permease
MLTGAMASRFATTAGPAIQALRVTLADAPLRRLVFAWFMVNAGKWAFLVTNLVVAYDRGGAAWVGALSVARYLTPGLIAPLAGLPTARWRPEAVLRATNATRTLAVLAAAAVIATGGAIELLTLVVAIEAGVGAFTRPVHMGLCPAVSRTPAQLIGANVTSSAAEALGTFVGPAVAGILLVATGPTAVMLAVAVVYAVGVLSIATLSIPAVGRRRGRASVADVIDDLTAGFRAASSIPGPRLVIVSLTLQCLVRGLLTVLIVVAAIELLGMGEPGVGTLNAAMGLGGLVGAALAIGLAGRDRLGPAFAVALAGWGAPIAMMGIIPVAVVAILAMAAIGAANAVLDVSGFTLAQRTAPNAARVSLLGLIDGAANLGPAIGAAIAPILAQSLGTRGALTLTGLILPIAALAIWPIVRRLDEGGPAAVRRVELLRQQALFAPLSLATIEHLAGNLVPVKAEPGETLIEEGAHGDEYFLLDQGDVEIEQGGTVIGRHGPGFGFGEIALLNDVPRTATVRAVSRVAAFSLGRDPFLEAVTGHAQSREAAEATAAEHLTGDARRAG